jgi:tetratricopeptide (TPR) repeat protein
VAGLLAAVAVLALAGVGGVTFQWRRAEAHLAEADRQRARAEANLRDTRKVVNEFFTQVSDNTLLNAPGMQPFRKDLLERARRYYQDLLARHGDDPALRHDLAEAQYRLARITSVLDSKEAGLRQMETARETCEELLRGEPGSALLRQNLATCHVAIGRIQGELGRNADALRSVEAGRAVLEELYRADPRAPERASSLRFAWEESGRLHRALDHLDQAAACYQRALALAQDEVRVRPTASVRSEVAQCQQSLALVHLARGQLGAARGFYAQALRGAEQLMQEDRAGMENRRVLASLYSNAGLFDTVREWTEPLTAAHVEKMRATAQKACVLWTGLAEENPTVTEYRVDLAIALHNLGRAQQLLRRYPEAVRAYTEAAERLTRVLREDRTLFKGHLTLADVRDHLGECQLQAGQPAEAEQTLAQARAALEELRRQDPGSPALRSRLAGVLGHWAQAAERQGRKEEALAACEEAASLQRAVCAAAPAEAFYRGELIGLLAELVRLQVQTGRPREAAAVCRERLALAAGNADVLYEVGRDLARCASLVDLGVEREVLVDQAVRALGQADQAGFADLARWEKDAALHPLRDHRDLRRLHERVRARARGR